METTEQGSVTQSDVELAAEFRDRYVRLTQAIRQVVVGQDPVVENLLTALLARGHALLIGVPGLAKTLLVKTLASALGWNFKRIQFTPDLMPSDIVGVEILQADPITGARSLKFVRGPVFANLVLADEINRTPPKTQAALLEAMQEYSVTAMGETLHLPHPFTVVATQNPIEHEGTYPLPEAQLDRFMFSIQVDYPDKAQEMQIVDSTTSADLPAISAVFSTEEFVRMQDLVRRVPVSRHVTEYAVTLARASRPKVDGADAFIREYVEWGAGPRASQYLVLAAKVRALLNGKPSPSGADIRAVALPIFTHRVIPNYNATGEGVTSTKIVEHLVTTVKEPSYQGKGT